MAEATFGGKDTILFCHDRYVQVLMGRGRVTCKSHWSEPGVASSDATNITCAITRDGDQYIVNGRKWWTSGRCKVSMWGAWCQCKVHGVNVECEVSM